MGPRRIEQRGRTRSQIPDENQLVAVANYDLRDHNLPQLTRDADEQIWAEFDREVALDVALGDIADEGRCSKRAERWHGE